MGVAPAWLTRALAAEGRKRKTLVAIFMRGAADGLSIVAPFGEEILFREPAGDRSLVMFDRGDEVVVQAGERGVRFLLVSGKPIKEPVAWHGPIVMNTQAELQTAISELRSGTFIKP